MKTLMINVSINLEINFRPAISMYSSLEVLNLFTDTAASELRILCLRRYETAAL